MDDRAGLFRPGWIAKIPVYGLEDRTASGEGMEPDDLLCSRNALSRTPLVGRTQWKINQPPSLRENKRAWKDHLYRSMRAVKDGLPTPSGEGEESEGPRPG